MGEQRALEAEAKLTVLLSEIEYLKEKTKGITRHVINQEITKELVTPAQVFVCVHVRNVYGCRSCEIKGDGSPKFLGLWMRTGWTSTFITMENEPHDLNMENE